MVFHYMYYKMEVLWNSWLHMDKTEFSSELSLLYIIKMFNLDDITNESKEKYKDKWPYIPDHHYRILIISGSGSGKTNALVN